MGGAPASARGDRRAGGGGRCAACARHSFDVAPALRKAPVTIELFPAFARDGGAQPWRATVRVRFLFRDPQPFGGARDVTVVAGGRARARRAPPPLLAVPAAVAPPARGCPPAPRRAGVWGRVLARRRWRGLRGSSASAANCGWAS